MDLKEEQAFFSLAHSHFPLCRFTCNAIMNKTNLTYSWAKITVSISLPLGFTRAVKFDSICLPRRALYFAFSSCRIFLPLPFHNKNLCAAFWIGFSLFFFFWLWTADSVNTFESNKSSYNIFALGVYLYSMQFLISSSLRFLFEEKKNMVENVCFTVGRLSKQIRLHFTWYTQRR